MDDRTAEVGKKSEWWNKTPTLENYGESFLEAKYPFSYACCCHFRRKCSRSTI
jgi:hypothetical protein